MARIKYEDFIVSIPDYPEKGVVFKDITPMIGDPQGFSAVIDEMAEHYIGKGITKVVGAEARGFLIGAPVAYRLGAGFVPARKPGKLPREVISQEYDLEYGKDEIQIHTDALTKGDKVLVVDDLVATGGTAIAQAKLIEKTGATLMGFGFAMELAFLHPRDIIKKEFDQEIYSLVVVE